MKVVKAEQATVLPFYVETDEEDYSYYRRNSATNWDQQVGESWEPAYGSKELERVFQSFIGEEGTINDVARTSSEAPIRLIGIGKVQTVYLNVDHVVRMLQGLLNVYRLGDAAYTDSYAAGLKDCIEAVKMMAEEDRV